ncbi:MAG TPA: 6,7-dimethyl-8-ribityllumazine synthase [Dinghuibacter sp.]|jgi:6,7-dimethyl-8-ribityllumazine synthase|uniref:6,7-dimethyl-8-ribityllumazine synthase n=1 Tax=Dinghuibacter sp. TaxID=2024697 RepID=UPI002CA9E8FA|nr:6,7-dimethyl-8-ribityllumazine synthase [Dinghuibacter sp.]HTJ14076.1 6,7-dimethyl-8-ribityllumazine synthase [Dinghuibacter sp.]
MAQVSNSNLYVDDAGILDAQDACVVIVRTEWNAAIVDALESGCRKTLTDRKVSSITTVTVPGAVEIPFAIKAYWESAKYWNHRPCVFIALGCVIQGGTPHFEYVCQSVTDGVTQLNLTLPVPVIFGVLTLHNEQQAWERLGGPHGHKGEEAAITALKMVALQRQMRTNHP